MPGVGDASFLSRESLLGLIELNRAELYEQGYPVQQLFMRSSGGQPVLFDAETALIETARDPRQEGVYATQPAAPALLGGEGYGQERVTVAYQAYKMLLRPNETALMREPGMPNGKGGMGSQIIANHRAQAERRVARNIRRMTEQVLRSDEYRCVKHLTTKTYTVPMADGGTSPAVTTNITAYKVPASWATAGTDIIKDITGKMLTNFVAQAGGPPTHMIYSFLLWNDLAANTALRTWAVSQQGGARLNEIPPELLAEPLASCEQIVHTTHIKNRAGTSPTFVWPRYVMTWIRETPETMGAGYAPNEFNEYGSRGYISTDEWRDPETGNRYQAVRSNLAPYVENHDNIMMFDLSTTAITDSVALPDLGT